MTKATKPLAKQALYSMLSSRGKKIVERLLELTQSKNENVALGACRLILNKLLPDMEKLNVNDFPENKYPPLLEPLDLR